MSVPSDLVAESENRPGSVLHSDRPTEGERERERAFSSISNYTLHSPFVYVLICVCCVCECMQSVGICFTCVREKLLYMDRWLRMALCVCVCVCVCVC